MSILIKIIVQLKCKYLHIKELSINTDTNLYTHCVVVRSYSHFKFTQYFTTFIK